VPGLKRDFRVKIAAERAEWKDAFQLVALNYQAVGYEAPLASKVRFTPYHALPDTVTFIAKHQGRVMMTFSLVPDNTMLGLPLQAIFDEEVNQLRRQRRRLAEVISLAADNDVSPPRVPPDLRGADPADDAISLQPRRRHLGHHGQPAPPRLLHQGDGLRLPGHAPALSQRPGSPGRSRTCSTYR
jgi:hypothetical protein